MTSDTTTTPDPTPDPTDPTPPAPANVDDDRATGYAVYDETLQRFVSGVQEKKADADKLAKNGPKGHTLKVRKV